MNLPASALLLPLVALLSGSLVWAPAARADTCEWEGSQGTAFETAGNWSCGRVPRFIDDVTIDGEVSLSSAPSVRSLTIKAGADIYPEGRRPNVQPSINPSSDFLWTGGSVGVPISVGGLATVEGDEDKLLRGDGRISTAGRPDAFRVSGPGPLVIDTNSANFALHTPFATLEGGARIESTGCCSTRRIWHLEELRVKEDAYVVDMAINLVVASVAADATLNISGGKLYTYDSAAASSRAFGDVPGYLGGRIVLGAPQPDRDAPEETEVTLREEFRLGDITWDHLSGPMNTVKSGGTTVLGQAGGSAGTFIWRGGSLNGPLTVGAGAPGVDLLIGPGGATNPELAGSSGRQAVRLTIEGRATLLTGATLDMAGGTSVKVSPGAHFIQEPASRVASLVCCSSRARIVNDGTWSTHPGDAPAELDSLSVDGIGVWDAGLGHLHFAGEGSVDLAEFMVTIDDAQSGYGSADDTVAIERVSAVAGDAYAPSSGDAYRVFEARSITVANRSVRGKGLPPGVGLALVQPDETGIDIVVGQGLGVTLSCGGCEVGVYVNDRRSPRLGNGMAQFRLALDDGATLPVGAALSVTFTTTRPELLVFRQGQGNLTCRPTSAHRSVTCDVPAGQLASSGAATLAMPFTMFKGNPPQDITATIGATVPLSGVTSATTVAKQEFYIDCEPATCVASGQARGTIPLSWLVISPFKARTTLTATFDLPPGVSFVSSTGWTCRPGNPLVCQASIAGTPSTSLASMAKLTIQVSARSPGRFSISGTWPSIRQVPSLNLSVRR